MVFCIKCSLLKMQILAVTHMPGSGKCEAQICVGNVQCQNPILVKRKNGNKLLPLGTGGAAVSRSSEMKGQEGCRV